MANLQKLNELFETIKILKPVKNFKEIESLRKENYFFFLIKNSSIHTFEYVAHYLSGSFSKVTLILKDKTNHSLHEEIIDHHAGYFVENPTNKLLCIMLKSDNAKIDEKNIAFLRVQKLLAENLSIELNDRIKRYGKIEY